MMKHIIAFLFFITEMYLIIADQKSYKEIQIEETVNYMFKLRIQLD
jgi:hypothetical protein